MDKIVMTLLVRRDPSTGTDCPYAVQITFPREMTPGKITPLTSVRLIDGRSGESFFPEADSYNARDWRAAALWEQAEFAARYIANPKPWFCILHSLNKSVYDYPGAGNKETNNGQVWAEIEGMDTHWKIGRHLQNKCEDEMDAEWNTRVAKAGLEPLAVRGIRRALPRVVTAVLRFQQQWLARTSERNLPDQGG